MNNFFKEKKAYSEVCVLLFIILGVMNCLEHPLECIFLPRSILLLFFLKNVILHVTSFLGFIYQKIKTFSLLLMVFFIYVLNNGKNVSADVG